MPKVTQPECRAAALKAVCCPDTTLPLEYQVHPSRSGPWPAYLPRALQKLCWGTEQVAPCILNLVLHFWRRFQFYPEEGSFSTFPEGPGTSKHGGSGIRAEQTEMPGKAKGLLVQKPATAIDRWPQLPVLPHCPLFSPVLANS